MATLIPGTFGSYQSSSEDETRELETLRESFRAKNPGDAVGYVARFQCADSYAEYMVVAESPLTLVHLGYGDAWTAEPALIRGLIIEDIYERMARDEAIAQMFAKKTG